MEPSAAFIWPAYGSTTHPRKMYIAVFSCFGAFTQNSVCSCSQQMPSLIRQDTAVVLLICMHETHILHELAGHRISQQVRLKLQSMKRSDTSKEFQSDLREPRSAPCPAVRRPTRCTAT